MTPVLSRLLLVLPRLLVVLALALGALAAPGAAAAAPPTPGQSTYVPLPPVRLLDTRESGGPVAGGGTVEVAVAGRGGVPASATAVALSVTVLNTGTAATDVRVYPAPAVPDSSSVVVRPGRTASNLVVTALGEGGRVGLRNAAGSVQLLVDLAGYYAEGPGSSYVPATPQRLLDTRELRRPLGPGEVRTLRVAGGSTGVPPDATAVSVNLTAVGATRTTDVRAYPSGAGVPPTVSNSNPSPGRPTAVAAVVAVGRDGSVDLRNAAGSVHLVVDLQGWYVPGEAAVFHPLPPSRLLDTRVDGPAVAAGAPRDLVVAGAGRVPAQASAVALTVTALGGGLRTTTDVRVYPVPPDGSSVPPSSSLNLAPGDLVANTVLSAVGRDGSVRLRNAAGAVHLVVDLAGWYGPSGRGWDVSWPQCTSRGATTSRLPDGGAFAVVGLTRGTPYTDNECFAAQWAWASSLPGEPAVYLNTDAPGAASPRWGLPGPRPCSGASSDPGCGFNYGYGLSAYALERLPPTPRGGRPFVWFDVEGPYASGPSWQTGYAGAVAVNRAVLDGAAQRLREAGHRYGVYTDRASAGRDNDWVQIMGQRRLPDLQLWVFRAPTADPRPLCTPQESVTGGPVVMVQVQPAQSGQAYDVDDLC